MLYKILPQRKSRIKTDHIIITQMKNLYVDGTVIPDYVKNGTYKMVSRIWEDYFYKQITPMLVGRGSQAHGAPYHYMMESIGNDYLINMGTPDYAPSYWVEDLVRARLIPSKYRGAIVISLAENFSLDIIERRMAKVLAHRLIVPLLLRKDYNVDVSRVVYIDDILDFDNLGTKISNCMLPYSMEKTKYYKHDLVMMEAKGMKALVQKY